MAEVQRRATTSVTDLAGSERRERRKSGIFFFNRSFKKSSSSGTKGDVENESAPITPTLGPTTDGRELKRSESGRSIPVLAQTSSITAEAEHGALTSSPKTTSLSLSTHQAEDGAEVESKPTEDLPTPPDTPGPSNSADAATIDESPDEASKAEKASGQAEAGIAASTVTKITYHDDPDLDVEIREDNREGIIYAVRASVLENASKVWRDVLLSKAPGGTIDLSSDPGFGLSTIFSIAHYRFHDVPRTLGASELYDVAITAEKYQTLHLLVPFVKAWVSSLSVKESDPLAVLVAGCILGQPQWVSQVLTQCANGSSIDGARLVDAAGQPWMEKPGLSSEVVDLLAAVRLYSLEQITKAVSAPVNKLLNPQQYPDEDVPRYCHAGEDVEESIREECEQLQLGSAIMGLTKARLWPPPEASRIKISPVELARTYTGVRMRRYQTSGLRFQEGDVAEDVHSQCGFGHQDEFEKILSKSAQLTTSLVKELQTRAKISGVYGEDVFEDFTAYLNEAGGSEK